MAASNKISGVTTSFVAMFEEYPPISIGTQETIDDLNVYFTKKGTKFVATEKANFSFLCDGKTTVCARRRGVITSDEKYFEYHDVEAKYSPSVLKVFCNLKSFLGPKLTEVIIYGELFGGAYPHPLVKTKTTYTPIQKGIYYAPWIDFYAYDIFATVDEVSRWLNFDTCQRLFAEYGFFYAKPLIIGTLAECFAFSIERNSIIPEQLGLPPLGGNQIEGIVIKGTNNEQIPDAQERAIFKKKNRNFTEVNDPVPLAQKNGQPVFAKAPAASLDQFPIPSNIEALGQKKCIALLYKLCMSCVNDNRLASAVSKIGPLSKENSVRIKNELSADIMTDITASRAKSVWENLNPNNRDKARRSLDAAVERFLSEHLAHPK